MMTPQSNRWEVAMARFNKFGLIMVVVSNMERSVAFYRDVLDLKLKFSTPDWSEFDVGGVGLGLHPESHELKVGDPRRQGVLIGFYTDDIAKTCVELTDKGAEFTLLPREEEFGKLAIFTDPDG